MRAIGFIFILLGLIPSILATGREALPSRFMAKVISISDGDTFGVLYQGKEIKIRLRHIDCPERGQAFSKQAKYHLSGLCFGKIISIHHNGQYDRYGRLIAICYVDGIEINKNMLSSGWAWHFKKYSSDPAYDQLEKEARKRGVGLWQQSNPIAPWSWRVK